MHKASATAPLAALLWLTLTAPAPLPQTLTVSGVVYQDRNQNGQIDKGEKGMPEVVVSDGVEVVTTDHQGRYTIATESSRILFVSLPGGHFAKGDSYRRLTEHKSGDELNFPLVKHKTKKTLKFIFFTDPHLTPEPKYNAEAGMKAAIKHMNAQKPVFFLSGGDLINDAQRACEPDARKQFDLYKKLAAEFNAPVFNTIGNHDNWGIYLEGEWGDTCIVGEDHPSYGARMYREYFGPDYYSFNYGEYHFFVFNTIGITWTVTRDNDTIRTYYGSISQQQIDWVKKDLQHLSSETPIILVGHIPFMTQMPIFIGYRESQIIAYDLDNPERKSFKHVVRNASEILNEVFAGYNVILALSGHIHNHEVTFWGDQEHGAHFIVGGAVCGAWWAGDRKFGGSSWPEGYLLLTLRDGRLKDYEYVSFGWEGYDE